MTDGHKVTVVHGWIFIADITETSPVG